MLIDLDVKVCLEIKRFFLSLKNSRLHRNKNPSRAVAQDLGRHLPKRVTARPLHPASNGIAAARLLRLQQSRQLPRQQPPSVAAVRQRRAHQRPSLRRLLEGLLRHHHQPVGPCPRLLVNVSFFLPFFFIPLSYFFEKKGRMGLGDAMVKISGWNQLSVKKKKKKQVLFPTYEKKIKIKNK
jgi:hypothetical protein